MVGAKRSKRLLENTEEEVGKKTSHAPELIGIGRTHGMQLRPRLKVGMASQDTMTTREGIKAQRMLPSTPRALLIPEVKLTTLFF